MRYVFEYHRFASDLRKWRKVEELTKSDAGELFGVTSGMIGSWERGWCQGMSMASFMYACEWMNTDPGKYFTHVTGDMPY